MRLGGRYYYCHECGDWTVCIRQYDDTWMCPDGDMILCDECGRPYREDHDHPQ